MEPPWLRSPHGDQPLQFSDLVHAGWNGGRGGGGRHRLPGFTSRKPMDERRDGAFPYVLVRHSRPGPDPAGAALVTEARDRLARLCRRPAGADGASGSRTPPRR